MNGRFLPVLGVALSIVGCGAGDLVKPAPLALVGPVVLRQVRAAPDSVAAAGVELRLSTYLWRDFMPPAPADGEPLRAILRIATTDSSAFPAELGADAAWVLNDGATWATWVKETRPRHPADPWLEVFAEGGPKWGPGIEVDVVVRLRDGSGGAWYLRARGQTIHRTD